MTKCHIDVTLKRMTAEYTLCYNNNKLNKQEVIIMPFKVADYAKEVIAYAEKGFDPLRVANCETILNRYTQQKNNYIDNASAIASYFLLHFADSIIGELENFDDKYKAKTWKGSAAASVGGPIAASARCHYFYSGLYYQHVVATAPIDE